MNRNIKIFGIVMVLGASVIALMLFNFPIAIWAGNGLLKWEMAATIFLIAGSFITVWGITELREKNRGWAVQIFMIILTTSIMIGLFCRFWTFMPQHYFLLILDFTGLIGMFSLPISRYLDRKEATRRSKPRDR
jgi:hypothetical protein